MPGYKFCDTIHTPYIHHTDIWITIPRVGLKALELIRATKLYKVCMNFHLKIPLYQRFHTFFGDFTPFFTPFSKIFFHFIVRLLKCYKNIYDLHTFSIRNSSKLAISHLFSRFHTFFSHLFQLFFYSLRTPHSYPPVKKNYVDSYVRS